MINWYYAEVVGQPCLSIAIVQNSLEWTQSQMNSIRTDQLIFISCCRIFILSYEELYSMKKLCYWTIGIIDTLWLSLLLYYILYYSLAANNASASFPCSYVLKTWVRGCSHSFQQKTLVVCIYVSSTSMANINMNPIIMSTSASVKCWLSLVLICIERPACAYLHFSVPSWLWWTRIMFLFTQALSLQFWVQHVPVRLPTWDLEERGSCLWRGCIRRKRKIKR